MLMEASELRLKWFIGIVPYSREILKLTDGGTLAIEWAYVRPQKT